MKRYQSIKLLGIAAAMIFAGNATALDNSYGSATFSATTSPRATHVPVMSEAETWAIAVVGLGLVGLRLRRKDKTSSSEGKF